VLVNFKKFLPVAVLVRIPDLSRRKGKPNAKRKRKGKGEKKRGEGGNLFS